MKKFFVIFLVCTVFLIGVSAIAEENTFTLRDGIQFGDTMEEVKTKESLGVAENSTGAPYLTSNSGTVAGIPHVRIQYSFDKATGLLNDVLWYLPLYDVDEISNAVEISNNEYNTLHDAFVKKYGQPLGYSNGSCYIISGQAISYAFDTIDQFSSFLGWTGDICNYAEWDVNLGNGHHVKIELVQFCYGPSSMGYMNSVSYTPFTDEDLENALKEKQEENDALMNDI